MAEECWCRYFSTSRPQRQHLLNFKYGTVRYETQCHGEVEKKTFAEPAVQTSSRDAPFNGVLQYAPNSSSSSSSSRSIVANASNSRQVPGILLRLDWHNGGSAADLAGQAESLAGLVDIAFFIPPLIGLILVNPGRVQGESGLKL